MKAYTVQVFFKEWDKRAYVWTKLFWTLSNIERFNVASDDIIECSDPSEVDLTPETMHKLATIWEGCWID